MKTPNDRLQHFIFDKTNINGKIASLDTAITDLFQHQNPPAAIKQLMNEFMLATALLSSTLKFEGKLILQARGSGPLAYIMAEATNNQQLRAIASPINEEDADQGLKTLLGKDAVLAITIEPTNGKRYQGIVPLDEENLADCLAHYFKQSEQLPTRFWLSCSATQASGMVLQALPNDGTSISQEEATIAWENRIQLANTLSDNELLTMDHETILTRLFHEEGVRLLDEKPLKISVYLL